MPEDPLLAQAHVLAEKILHPPFAVQRGSPFLYHLAASRQDGDLQRPGVFDSTLCVFEVKPGERVQLARTVIEFTPGIAAHGTVLCSLKARKLKQACFHLRYGLVLTHESTIPVAVFAHNEALDFAVAVKGLTADRFADVLQHIIEREVAASRQLEEIAFEKLNVVAFCTELVLERSS